MRNRKDREREREREVSKRGRSDQREERNMKRMNKFCDEKLEEERHKDVSLKNTE